MMELLYLTPTPKSSEIKSNAQTVLLTAVYSIPSVSDHKNPEPMFTSKLDYYSNNRLLLSVPARVGWRWNHPPQQQKYLEPREPSEHV